ncbi:GntP family permease [Hellea balneolensis]|uniref:GntP family permease n=1 Tax=Hellea balneolensis TaxID=287478 RepID=UPI00042721CE|nr:gluconate:H+ symporter [Hellea balneolensis]
MDTMMPLFITAAGLAVLLLLVLRLKIPAFLALIGMSLLIGMAVGMAPIDVISSMQKGMGGTLGFVAIVVGLGAMFGALLEAAGGVTAVSESLLKRFGDERAPWALGLVGFLIAIPVFFDVAFIILVPVIHKLSQKSGKALLVYALPLLAGLAVTHAFIPPTPGPIAVADLLGADLGWVILLGAAAGLPAMILAGPVLARFYKNTAVSTEPETPIAAETPINFWHAIFAILLPLFLIIGSTVAGQVLADGRLKSTLQVLGHPFTALIIAVGYAYIAFGVSRSIPLDKLQDIMNRALLPAGIVILITGAGGVLKQVLIDSGVGAQLAAVMTANSIPLLLFAFLVSAIVRVAQGSATVAMLTGAGLTAPLLVGADLSAPDKAILVIAIASGASLLSHVNDSGFWLVNRYLGQTEAETLKSWTVASTVVGVSGFVVACLLSLVF